MFYTYILYSSTINQYYSGQTHNLENRIKEHNNGETKSIIKGIPWELIWMQTFDNRTDAMKMEKKIKARGAKRFLQNLGL